MQHHHRGPATACPVDRSGFLGAYISPAFVRHPGVAAAPPLAPPISFMMTDSLEPDTYQPKSMSRDVSSAANKTCRVTKSRSVQLASASKLSRRRGMIAATHPRAHGAPRVVSGSMLFQFEINCPPFRLSQSFHHVLKPQTWCWSAARATNFLLCTQDHRTRPTLLVL
ncbi:hypothetical protein BV25DRAFT_1181027 [Artomyces pyxidatus]|uniref:Uncharacterized protein n=1 Tax=Artomyces pyxidatus TaxID=48021 RepID=A0ACB8SQW3_9AGAM|nr:hypothetical protein BV25DRAFT_1181027 [Artomyces pyxidatus]